MNDERQNAFEKAQPRTTLRDERKTKFVRNDEARAARLRSADTQQARIARNAQQHASWAGAARAGGVRTASGVSLDSVTAKLKSAAEASRQPKSPSLPEPSDATVYAIAQQWMADHPNFYRSAHNGENFKNFLFHQISLGKLTWNYESFSIAHDWLESAGYFEKVPARKRREFATTCSPRTYPKFVSDAERVAEDDCARMEQARRIEQEISRALSIDFATLRREVRGALPQYGREEVR